MLFCNIEILILLVVFLIFIIFCLERLKIESDVILRFLEVIKSVFFVGLGCRVIKGML